jgi:hypothetical protein
MNAFSQVPLAAVVRGLSGANAKANTARSATNVIANTAPRTHLKFVLELIPFATGDAVSVGSVGRVFRCTFTLPSVVAVKVQCSLIRARHGLFDQPTCQWAPREHSDAALVGGSTHPDALDHWMTAGAAVWSLQDLHAKVVLLDETDGGQLVLIGSANVSDRSNDDLLEAVVATNEENV